MFLLTQFTIRRLLIPIALEKARVQFLLSYASRNVLLTRIGNTNNFKAVVPGELTVDDITALSATVGCSVNFFPMNKEGRILKENLFVRQFEGNTLSLTYPSRSGFTKDDECLDGPKKNSPLYDAKGFSTKANFVVPVMEFKLLETGVIDAMTACGHVWFEDERMPNSGKPLVKQFFGLAIETNTMFMYCTLPWRICWFCIIALTLSKFVLTFYSWEPVKDVVSDWRMLLQIHREQLERLGRGEGFFDPRLTESQKEAVFVALQSAGTIKALLGGGGCGKTCCLDEAIMQLAFHHTEDTPSSAL
jgi:hypothetical protein